MRARDILLNANDVNQAVNRDCLVAGLCAEQAESLIKLGQGWLKLRKPSIRQLQTRWAFWEKTPAVSILLPRRIRSKDR